MKSLTILTFFLFSFQLLIAQNFLPAKLALVNDYEEVFSAKEEKTLTKMIKKISKKSGDNLAMISINSFEPADNIQEFSYALINEWKMGPKGILIVFSKNNRSVRIETSAEIWGRLSDEEVLEIINQKMLPDFKNEAYYQGIVKALKAIEIELK
jgi:uncharacterized protein